jgi:hypothetical protein
MRIENFIKIDRANDTSMIRKNYVLILKEKLPGSQKIISERYNWAKVYYAFFYSI